MSSKKCYRIKHAGKKLLSNELNLVSDSVRFLFVKNSSGLTFIEGRILLRESSQGESSGLRVRHEGSLKTHYDAYSLPGYA